jgi:hypothetical protein
MKRKTLVLAAVLSIFISLGISGGEVNAAAWYTCTVDATGPAGGNVMVQLTDTAATPAFTAKWFATSNSNVTGTNRILAAVLTAMSLEKTVQIAVDNLVPTYPVILNLYILK